MFFINEGKVIVFEKLTEIVYNELTDNNCFGEVGFFSRMPRCASVESVSFASVSYINLEDFIRVANFVKDQEFKDYVNLLTQSTLDEKYDKLEIKCYMCSRTTHLAPYCPNLINKDELFKYKFRGKISY